MILKAKTQCRVYSINKINYKFQVLKENNFVVLPCGNIIIGVDAKEPRNLIMVDITQNSRNQYTYIGSLKIIIENVLYFPKLQTLLSGDVKGNLVQYEIDPFNRSFKMIKEYGDLDLRRITSCSQFMHLAFVGGMGVWHGTIAIINIRERRVVQIIGTSSRFIETLEICTMPGPKAYLTVSGWGNDYSKNKKDVFELSQSILNLGVKESLQGKKKRIKQIHEKMAKIPIIKKKIITLRGIVKSIINHLKNEDNKALSVNAIFFEINQQKEKLQKIITEFKSHFEKEKERKHSEKMRMDRELGNKVKKNVNYGLLKQSENYLNGIQNFEKEFNKIKKLIMQK
jgi:hypothetical protein